MSISYNYPLPATLKELCTRLHEIAGRKSNRFSFVDCDGSEVFKKAWTDCALAANQSQKGFADHWDHLPSNSVFRTLHHLVKAGCLHVASFSSTSILFKIIDLPNLIYLLSSPRIERQILKDARKGGVHAPNVEDTEDLDEEDAPAKSAKVPETKAAHFVPPGAVVIDPTKPAEPYLREVQLVVGDEFGLTLHDGHLADMESSGHFDVFATKATLLFPVSSEVHRRVNKSFAIGSKPDADVAHLCRFIEAAKAIEGCQVGWAGNTLVVRPTTDLPTAHIKLQAAVWNFKCTLRTTTRDFVELLAQQIDEMGYVTESDASIRMEVLDCGPNKFAEPEVKVDITITPLPASTLSLS